MHWLAIALALQGDLARGPVKQVIAEHRAEVAACYQDELARRPAAHGKLVVQIDIAADGAVTGASATKDEPGSPELTACVLGAVRSWKFPAGAEAMRVSWPFVFERAASGR